MEVLQGHFKEGDTVLVDNDAGRLVFRKASPAAAPEPELATAAS
jgi:hypothetical protein